MLFKIFNSQEERKKYGGSAFIEIQFCRLPMGTNVKDIVAGKTILCMSILTMSMFFIKNTAEFSTVEFITI